MPDSTECPACGGTAYSSNCNTFKAPWSKDYCCSSCRLWTNITETDRSSNTFAEAQKLRKTTDD